MQALVQERYGPIDNLRLVERDKPTVAKDAVLIRVRAAGIDPGIWHMATGRPYFARLAGIGFSRPKTPIAGWDASGVVYDVGSAVTRFKVGDDVFGNCASPGSGTFAEYACLPEQQCALKPPSMSFEVAAALSVSGCTALQATRDVAKVTSGQRVLVLGASGGVGHFAVQIARSYGAVVTGVCGPDKLNFVRSLGAHDVLDYTSDDLGTRQWDVIIDTAGRRSVRKLRHSLTPFGRLALVGGDGGNAWTGEFIERAFVGAMISLFSKRKISMVAAKVKSEDLLTLSALVVAGKLTAVLERQYRLGEAVSGLKVLEQGHARGKSVVVLAD